MEERTTYNYTQDTNSKDVINICLNMNASVQCCKMTDIATNRFLVFIVTYNGS